MDFFSNFAADIQKLSVLSDEEYTGTKTDIPQTTKYPVVYRAPVGPTIKRGAGWCPLLYKGVRIRTKY